MNLSALITHLEEMNNSFSFLPFVVVPVCLDLMLVYMCSAYHCLSIIACNLVNYSDINSIFMENASRYEKSQPCKEFRHSELGFREP